MMKCDQNGENKLTIFPEMPTDPGSPASPSSPLERQKLMCKKSGERIVTLVKHASWVCQFLHLLPNNTKLSYHPRSTSRTLQDTEEITAFLHSPKLALD